MLELNNHQMSALDLLNNFVVHGLFNLDRELFHIEPENPRKLYKVQRATTER